MIEIYLASLLFGLGTMYNKSQKNKDRFESNDNESSDNESNPYNQHNLKNIENAENDLAKKLDTKCKTILPRSFSNLLDSNTSKKLDINDNVDILKYVPKNDNAIKSSLTGSDISIENFISSKTIGRENFDDVSTNTWAIPHFGGKATQNMDVNGYKSKLDIHTGRSDFNFHKKETKNFFKPSKDISFINGAPNVIDKLEDRYVKSNNRKSELPFEQIKVGPGLGKNYNSKPTGGFHQYDINDLVRPKNIDDLRVLSNPKETYKGRIISGKHIDKRSESSQVGKYRPDTFYLNTQSRWNKTTGANLKSKADETFIMPTVNKRHANYSGNAGPATEKNQTQRSKVQKSLSQRGQKSLKLGKSQAGAWTADADGADGADGALEPFQSKINNEKPRTKFDISNYGKAGIKLGPNERDTTQNKSVITNVVAIVKSIISPLQDKMKRTKKQNIEGNPNISGYIGTSIPEKATVYDPDDIARTTIRETTEVNEHEGNIDSGIKKLTVYDPNDIARTTIRETTEVNEHEGNIDSGIKKLTVYDPNDIARTTIRETTEVNEHDGNIDSGIKKLTVYDPDDIARTTIKETTEVNKMETQVKGATKLTVYDPNDVARTTLKETLIHDVRDGNIDVQRNAKHTDYNYASAKRTTKETTIYNKHNTNIAYAKGGGAGYLAANPFAPSTLKQLTSNNKYSGNVSSSINNKGGYTTNKFEAPATLKQFTSDNYYGGSANSSDKKMSDYTGMLNSETNPNKEIISKGRAPTQTGVKLMASSGEQGFVGLNKQNINFNTRERSNISVSNGGSISSNGLGNTATRTGVSLSTRGLEDNINPKNLSQLDSNPYALSINRPPVAADTDTDTDSDYFGGI